MWALRPLSDYLSVSSPHIAKTGRAQSPAGIFVYLVMITFFGTPKVV